MALEYLGFLVTVVALVEENTLYVTKRVYGLGRTRVPGLCVPLLSKGERAVSMTYSTLRSWISKHGKALVNVVDDTWMKDMCPETVKERIVVVKDFWEAVAARVAEAWTRHGVLMGTVVMLVALFYALLHLWHEVWGSPFVQEYVTVVRESLPVKLALSYFQENIEPVLTDFSKSISATAGRTYEMASGSFESVKRSTDACVDGVLASQLYSSVYDGIVRFLNKLHTISYIQSMSKKMAPIWKEMEKHDVFIAFMEKLKPMKEHHDKEE